MAFEIRLYRFNLFCSLQCPQVWYILNFTLYIHIYIYILTVTKQSVPHFSVSSKIAIVTGDETGQIRFSDRDFKLLYWYNDFRYGRIASIGFSDKGLFNE